jgi:nucleoside-diphosphate-sugar epimerase
MTLRVFVAGATGVLGKRLVAELADRGHVVVGLTRDREGDELVAERGGVPRRGDVLDADSVEWAAADADVVVHAATAIPTERDPDEEDWASNDRVRRQGAANLTNAAAKGAAERYVQASVVWVVRNGDGSPVDEASEPNPDRTTRSALEAEQRARAAERFGLEPVVLRTGWFYSADSDHTRRMAERVLEGRLPAVAPGLLGRGDAELSLIHPDDAARAFADAVEQGAPDGGAGVAATQTARPPAGAGGRAGPGGPRGRPGAGPGGGPGADGIRDAGPTARARMGLNPSRGVPPNTYHVVDEVPVTLPTFLGALAERLGTSRRRRVPGWLARPFVGSDLVRFLTTGFPTAAERFSEDFGWAPEYATYREGLDEVVDTWREEGTLVEADDGLVWRGGD